MGIPRKKEIVVHTQLSKKQRDIYKEILEEEAILKSVKGEGSPLTAINRLRQLCSHPLS